MWNIVVLGCDKRMEYVAQYFYSVGYEAYREFDISIKKKYEQTILVLPPIANYEKAKEYEIYLDECDFVFAGAICQEFKIVCKERNIPVYDYLSIDKVTSENAILTAKGILRQAFLASANVEENECLVLGYGFCGKALVEVLKQYQASVDVLVRNSSLKKDIEQKSCRYLNFKNKNHIDFSKYSIVFNTVPALVIDETMLKQFRKDAFIFDIASKPGGTDFECAKELGIYAVNSLGIPGKEYPKEAGEIIAKAICEVLNDMKFEK